MKPPVPCPGVILKPPAFAICQNSQMEGRKRIHLEMIVGMFQFQTKNGGKSNCFLDCLLLFFKIFDVCED
jgi:hypothetical protein